MVGDAQLLRQFADRDPIAAGESLDREEALVLLWSQPVLPGSGFAETKEFAQRVSKRGQCFIVLLRQRVVP